MDIDIEFPDQGVVAKRAEIVDTHTDVVNMTLSVHVGLYNDVGDKVREIAVGHKLESLPIPQPDDMWAFITPVLDSLKQPL